NLFNGNSTFLNDNSKLAKELFKEHNKVLGQYMMAKTFALKGEEGLQRLVKNKVFSYARQDVPEPLLKGICFSSRRATIRKRYVEIRKLGPDDISKLDPEEVSEIAPHQVCWLALIEQVGNLPHELINDLTVSQIQRKLLPGDKIILLRRQELIQALLDVKDILLLDPPQLVSISDEQKLLLKQTIYKQFLSKGLNSIKDKHLEFLELTTEEIEPLTYQEMSKISSRLWPLISKSKLEKIQTEAPAIIDEQRVQRLTNTQLEILDPRYQNHLSDPQIKGLTEAHL